MDSEIKFLIPDPSSGACELFPLLETGFLICKMEMVIVDYRIFMKIKGVVTCIIFSIVLSHL